MYINRAKNGYSENWCVYLRVKKPILIYKQLQVKLPISFKVPCLSAQTPFNCEGALNIVALIGNFTSWTLCNIYKNSNLRTP